MAWDPGLCEALTGLGEGDLIVVEGTLILIERIEVAKPCYSMKHPKHGMNVQVIVQPDALSL